MVPKRVFAAVVGTMLLASSGASVAAGDQADEYQADEYQADQFLGLDLSKAVLSPKPLGPPTKFAPVRIQAKTDPASPAEPTRVKPKTVSEAAIRKAAIPKAHAEHAGLKKPHSADRAKLVRRHGNPLDAEAFDTRIQVWPCRSGGICNWQRH